MAAERPLHPRDLGLVLSYHCQSGCAHCLYNCGPSWSEWMTSADIRRALQMALIWEQPVQVHITGGEPFLNFSLLLQAVQTASDLGIDCYCETNAGWCANRELIEKRFRELQQAGLQAILISCSPFHAETIPPKRTLLAIAVALDVFGPGRVVVYLAEWLDQIVRFGTNHPTPLERYIDSFGIEPAGVMLWEGYALIPGGRSGYRLGHLTSKVNPAGFRFDNCRAEILFAHHSHFDLYGNYISGFCGGLSVGNWSELPRLIDNYERGEYPQLIDILVHEGPYGLYLLARRDYGYKPLSHGYAGKCHLCVDVRRRLFASSQFVELKPAGFYGEEIERRSAWQ